ncbi:MlaD family protein [Phenylobacterium sp.]|uniref:MlaD family protein n=1 Tax=Phenylobacterium sp. TaxID=1871053 RepID=UPI002722FCF0|nr:MlaD family protein [Phenylobacterium sp.]MDO8380127.1 MlaD family protein [Phenylobacterium sp.]
MEKDANYALVGLSTLILFLGLVIFGVWLAKVQFSRDYQLYDIIFQGPINGLTQGGEVRFNGIKVGEVTKIELARENPKNVVARARVTSDVPIRVDSVATLEPQGITGVNYVQISAGTPSKPLLREVTPDGKIPVIRSQRSTLSDLLEGGGTVLSRTVEALDRINKVLSDQNVKTFSAALSDTQAVTAELRERKAVIADAQKALQSIDTAAQSISALGASGQNLLDGDGKRTLTNLADAAEEAQAAAKDLRSMMGKLESPASDFATTGLPQLTAAAVQLQATAEAIERLANELQTNPRGAVAKPAGKELEVKP